MSRTKGARGEREFLALLGEELGEMLTRNLQQTREGGADCLCVKGWAIEVKRCEALSRPAWWRQAVEQANRLGVQPIIYVILVAPNLMVEILNKNPVSIKYYAKIVIYAIRHSK